MGEEGGIGSPHPTPTTHTPLLPTQHSHPLLSACHPACPPTCHPTAVEETTCNRTSITFPRATIFLHSRLRRLRGQRKDVSNFTLGPRGPFLALARQRIPVWLSYVCCAIYPVRPPPPPVHLGILPVYKLSLSRKTCG